MDKRIVYTNSDGLVHIVIPTPSLDVRLYDENGVMETEGDFVQRVANKDVPKGLSYRIIDLDQLPADRYFRSAWTDANDTPTVDIDMDKARNIHMDNLRQIRAAKFISLGFPNKLNPYLEKAIIPQETQDILQNLRNFPQVFDLSGAKTPEELKLLLPDILKE